MLIVLGGLPGVGKSTVARRLAAMLGAVWLRIDAIEQGLRDAHGPDAAIGPAGYAAAQHLAEGNLSVGATVVADAVNPIELCRAGWRAAAARADAPILEVELVCADLDTHRRRVETRAAEIPGAPLPDWEEVMARRADWEPWGQAALRIDTGATDAARACAAIATATRAMRGDTPGLTWFSENVEKRESGIEGVGLFAAAEIRAGELVVVKGGHVFDRATRDRMAAQLGPAEIQIDDHLFIGPVHLRDRDAGMMHLNHSCAPNVGIRGQISFHAMRDIRAGEELSFDYATGDDDDWEMACRCGAVACRGRVTGRDWRDPELQRRYAGWFSDYLARRIAADERG